jgi:ABC-2 type transport system ATP-binding protein
MIHIKDLTKVYRETTAVDHVDLNIKRGEVFGFLGPNGAGKTTIILILSTLLEPTSGNASINGNDVKKNPQLVKRDIGVLFQEPSHDDRLTGYENLEIQAILYDVSKEQRRGRIIEMLDFVGLKEWANTPVERYSGGMKRRLEIARCLIHKPKVLLFDEPTLGLDPNARERVWKHIEELKNITVLVATNYIEEAEALCDRLAIIDSGKIVAVGAPDALKSSLKRELAQIKVKDTEKLKLKLKKLPFVEKIRVDGQKINFTIKGNKRRKLLDALARFDLDSFEIRKPTLSDVFFEYTGKSIEVPIKPSQKRRGLGRRTG